MISGIVLIPYTNVQIQVRERIAGQTPLLVIILCMRVSGTTLHYTASWGFSIQRKYRVIYL